MRLQASPFPAATHELFNMIISISSASVLTLFNNGVRGLPSLQQMVSWQFITRLPTLPSFILSTFLLIGTCESVETSSDVDPSIMQSDLDYAELFCIPDLSMCILLSILLTNTASISCFRWGFRLYNERWRLDLSKFNMQMTI